jgi:hypothetical protein
MFAAALGHFPRGPGGKSLAPINVTRAPQPACTSAPRVDAEGERGRPEQTDATAAAGAGALPVPLSHAEMAAAAQLLTRTWYGPAAATIAAFAS